VLRTGRKEEVINGVYVHRVKALRLHFPDLTYPSEYVEKVLRDADIVHGHSQNSLFTVKIVEKAKSLGVKTAMYFMAVDALYDHPNPLVRLPRVLTMLVTCLRKLLRYLILGLLRVFEISRF